MNFKPVVMLGLWLAMGGVFAQSSPANSEWKESAVPTPPAFRLDTLLPFEGSGYSSLVFAVDPKTIQLTPSDGVIRYVMVATSASGARNILYEGLRCATGESKTYARFNSDKWTMVTEPKWVSVFDNQPSRHALRFAKAGACSSSAPQSSVEEIIRALRQPQAAG